jgi:hypothetical protein
MPVLLAISSFGIGLALRRTRGRGLNENVWDKSADEAGVPLHARSQDVESYGLGGGADSTLPIPRSSLETSKDIRYWTATYF